MSSEISITRAYCVELDREVTISEARLEYLALEFPPAKFRFLCSDPNCWDGADGPGVMIVGANYRTPAEHGAKYRTPYFRREPRSSEHRDGCMWITCDADSVKGGNALTDEEIARQEARRKMTDLVDVFDPRNEDELKSAGVGTNQLIKEYDNTSNSDHARFKKINQNDRGGITVTSQFHRLVESFREAKRKLSKEEFNRLYLKIKGERITRWNKYFTQLRFSMNDAGHQHDGVIYGGARLYKRYGNGFALQFFDKLNDYPVSLYVSSEQLRNYRLSRSFTRVIDTLEQGQNNGRRPYVTVYTMGGFVPGQKEGTLSLVVKDLRHFYLALSVEG